MRKVLLILLCVPLMFSCGKKNEEKGNDAAEIAVNEGNNTEDSLSKEITLEMMNSGYTGKGTYVFPNGLKYVGEFKDGRYHGQGTFTNTKGDKYVGDFRDGFFNGKGTYTWGEGNNKGDKYVGEWRDGKHNGQGTYTWGEGDNKGDKYVGEFINNQKTGQGTCTYANGEKYVGEWKDGKSHGEGVYTLSDGRIIEGLFEDGQYKNILSDEYNDSGTTIDFDNGEKHIVE